MSSSKSTATTASTVKSPTSLNRTFQNPVIELVDPPLLKRSSENYTIPAATCNVFGSKRKASTNSTALGSSTGLSQHHVADSGEPKERNKKIIDNLHVKLVFKVKANADAEIKLRGTLRIRKSKKKL